MLYSHGHDGFLNDILDILAFQSFKVPVQFKLARCRTPRLSMPTPRSVSMVSDSGNDLNLIQNPT